MKTDYEFIVFNDAKGFPDFTNGNNPKIRYDIEETCVRLGIRCISIPNDNHVTNTCALQRCADSCNFMLKYQLENPDKYLLIDSDMFPIDSFDYSQYDAAVVIQDQVVPNYFWNGIVYFDTTRMTHRELLNWNPAPRTDVGGMMYAWLKSQSTTFPSSTQLRSSSSQAYGNIYYIRHLASCSWDESELPKEFGYLYNFLYTDPRNINGKFFCEIFDGKFLHYRAGGNWMRNSMNEHIALTEKLYNLLKDNTNDTAVI